MKVKVDFPGDGYIALTGSRKKILKDLQFIAKFYERKGEPEKVAALRDKADQLRSEEANV